MERLSEDADGEYDIRILSNPVYTGAYVYGRWSYTGNSRSKKSGKVIAIRPD